MFHATQSSYTFANDPSHAKPGVCPSPRFWCDSSQLERKVFGDFVHSCPTSSLPKISPLSCPVVTVWLGHESLSASLLSVPVFKRWFWFGAWSQNDSRQLFISFYVSFLSCSDLKSAKPQLLASRDLILAANVSTFDNLSIITCSEDAYTPRKVLKVTTEQRWKLGSTMFNMLQLDIDTVESS